MAIEDVVKEIVVEATAEHAFKVFTDKIGAWWPLKGHSISESVGAKGLTVEIEPFVGGEIVETSDAGEKYVWGRIRDWQPGERLKFSWLMGLEEAEASEVEVTFAQEGQKCRVTLVHRNWDGYGEGAQAKRDNYNKGWDLVFGQCFMAASAEAE